MTRPVDLALTQNLITLSHLEAKDYGQAVTSSLSALAYLRQSESLNSDDKSALRNQSCNLSLDQCMLLSQSCKADNVDSSQVFIYDHGIMLPQMTTDLAIITPILIFNAAVSQHLATYARGCWRDDLESAKRLYKLAYGTQAVSHNKLFRFAIINNIAVIDRQLGNTEESEYYIKQLMSVLMLMVDQKRHAELQQLQGFFVNIPACKTTASAAWWAA